jgi:hypothetical protein
MLVRAVSVVEQSSSYPAVDANIIAALQHWQLRPDTWREFQLRWSIGCGKNAQSSNQAKQPSR